MAILSTVNAKTAKGEGLGWLTAIAYLAPAEIGFGSLGRKESLCPAASAGCRAACLYSAGRGVQQARIMRAVDFIQDRPGFLRRLAREISGHVRRAGRLGLRPCVRLNGTTDIRFERLPFSWHGRRFRSVMHCFSRLQFYDYTKLADRFGAVPDNCHLTFSRSEAWDNQKQAFRLSGQGVNVAVVFAHRPFPRMFWGRPVVDGEAHDLRFLDPSGAIVGLRAKGRGVQDRTGFVVRQPVKEQVLSAATLQLVPRRAGETQEGCQATLDGPWSADGEQGVTVGSGVPAEVNGWNTNR